VVETSDLQRAQIDELLQQLDHTNDDLLTKAGRLAKKESTVEAAQSMLANLKPIIDALESQLTDDERAKA
jgi:hypothetical protein